KVRAVTGFYPSLRIARRFTTRKQSLTSDSPPILRSFHRRGFTSCTQSLNSFSGSAMFMKTTMRRWAKKVLRMGRDRHGSVAITFALALLPILGLVGAAIDYSHAISIRVALQAALDSTALMLSKQASSLNNRQLQSTAQNYFNGVFQRPEAQNVSITAT